MGVAGVLNRYILYLWPFVYSAATYCKENTLISYPVCGSYIIFFLECCTCLRSLRRRAEIILECSTAFPRCNRENAGIVGRCG